MNVLKMILGLFRPSPIHVSDRRVFEEHRRERYQDALTVDPKYRQKIKRRMLEGLTSRQLKPLYTSKRIRRARRAKPTNVMAFPKASER